MYGEIPGPEVETKSFCCSAAKTFPPDVIKVVSQRFTFGVTLT